MAKRDWPLRFKCAHPGCEESVTYRYDTRRDLQDSFELKHYGANGWKCTRHDAPDEVLGPENMQTRWESTSSQTEYGVFFGNSRYIHGPGFKIFAKDLPPGTKLIVTAQIELPA